MFTLSKEDEEKISTWWRTHSCRMRTSEHGIKDEIYTGAISSGPTYMYTVGSLGASLEVECPCGDRLDLEWWRNW